MAVQKSKKSRSRRGMRRSHAVVSVPELTKNSQGMTHRRHHMAADGSYRGKQYLMLQKEEHVHDEHCQHDHDHDHKSPKSKEEPASA